MPVKIANSPPKFPFPRVKQTGTNTTPVEPQPTTGHNLPNYTTTQRYPTPTLLKTYDDPCFPFRPALPRVLSLHCPCNWCRRPQVSRSKGKRRGRSYSSQRAVVQGASCWKSWVFAIRCNIFNLHMQWTKLIMLWAELCTRTADGKTPTINSPCDCHYQGTLIDGTEFDSSYKRGQPLSFAPNQVIKGWTEASEFIFTIWSVNLLYNSHVISITAYL